MPQAIAILAAKKLDVDNTKQLCTVDKSGKVTLTFPIVSSDIAVDEATDLAKLDFARAIFDFNSANLSPVSNELRSNITFEGPKIFLNISIQLSGVKGKHGN